MVCCDACTEGTNVTGCLRGRNSELGIRVRTTGDCAELNWLVHGVHCTVQRPPHRVGPSIGGECLHGTIHTGLGG